MAEPDEAWTVGRLLQWTIEYLGKHGAENPRLDAEVLLAEARGCRRIDLYTAFGEPADEQIRTAFRELVRRRAAGTPVAYLVGRREFYSLEFEVTPDVLIPRPETEHLVVAFLDHVKQRPASQASIEIADVGTGSGILAVCAAKYVHGSRVTAVDITSAAIEVSKRNADRHGVADRIEFVESDLFDSVPSDRRFDYILSNPPYVSSAEMANLTKNVREHEPRVALEAGERGTEVIARLIEQAAERVKPGGALFIEISPMIAGEVERLLGSAEKLETQPTIRDLAGHPRIAQAIARTGSREVQ
jgi:release factor glutamine methyltransferase